MNWKIKIKEITVNHEFIKKNTFIVKHEIQYLHECLKLSGKVKNIGDNIHIIHTITCLISRLNFDFVYINNL